MRLSRGSDGDIVAPVKHSVGRGLTILVSSNVLLRAVRLVGTVLLARLLHPDQYGVVAVATLVLGLGETLSDLRIGTNIIRSPAVTMGMLDTAFTLALLRGILVAGSIWLGSPLMAEEFGAPKASTLLQWLCLGMILESLRNPALLLYERVGDFRFDAAVNIAGTTTQVVASVSLAYLLRDERSIVFGVLLGRIVSVMLSYLISPFAPRLSLNGYESFLKFGGWLTAGGVVGYLNQRTDQWLVSTRLSTAVLGAYNAGQELASFATSELSSPLTRIFLPPIAGAESDQERSRLFNRSLSLTALLVLPVGFGTSAVAEQIINLALGPQWSVAIDVVQILAPVIAFSSVTSALLAIAISRGKLESHFRLQSTQLAVRIPLLLVGIMAAGLRGLLLARVATGLSSILLQFLWSKRVVGITGHAFLAAIWPSLLASTTMLAVLKGVDSLVTSLALTDWTTLTLKIALGATTYILSQMAISTLRGPSSTEARLFSEIRLRLISAVCTARGSSQP